MAIVFDDTVGGATANSYASVSDYNQYRENQGLATLADDPAKVALIRATAWIDANYRDKWTSQSKTDSDQALHWPQSGATDQPGGIEFADDIIPQRVKQAVFEYAIRAAGQSGLDPQTATNVKSQELEGLGRKEFFGRTAEGSLPDKFKFVDQILYGLIIGRSGGLRMLRMERSG